MTTDDPSALAARLRAGANASFLAKLGDAKLRGADLQGVQLRGADLQGADLGEANLRKADLREADLRRTILRGADMRGAIMRRADLREAKLGVSNRHPGSKAGAADMRGADLRGANLRGASLRGVKFGSARLGGADLREAKLRGAKLQEADLRGARVRGASFRACNLRGVALLNLELSAGVFLASDVAGAFLDWRTVARSLHLDGLQEFLVRTGLPEVLAIYMIESLRTIDEMDLFTMLQSVFISYGRPDETFAHRLRQTLTANGVRTWFFPRDAEPGARLHRHLQSQINSYDRMILCCSPASLKREGVLHEVEEVLEREQDEGGTEVMIPILVESIFDTGKTPPAWWPEGKEHVYLALRRRVAADFRGAMDDESTWREQIGRVLKALRKRRGPDG